MINLYGFVAQKSLSPQVRPLKGAGQVHLNPFELDVHLPPLLHGLGAQKSPKQIKYFN